jgi:hypothetical protein
VVEVWHADGLHVGNFRGRAAPPSRALLVELSSAGGSTPVRLVAPGGGGGGGDGEDLLLVKIDAGQLVGVWPPGEPHTPTGPATWAQIHRRAAAILSELPPHVLDLNPLWQRLVSAPAKRRVVTPTQAAEALFTQPGGAGAGRVLGRGVTPIGGNRGASQVRQRSSAAAAAAAAAEALNVFARRVAAGQLLAGERIMFRRQPLVIAPPLAPYAEGRAEGCVDAATVADGEEGVGVEKGKECKECMGEKGRRGRRVRMRLWQWLPGWMVGGQIRPMARPFRPRAR